jgi:hypothetical protein
LDSALPRPAQITTYARVGDLLFFAAVAGTMFASLLIRLKY